MTSALGDSTRRLCLVAMGVLALFALGSSVAGDASAKGKKAKVTISVTTKNQAALVKAGKVTVKVKSTEGEGLPERHAFGQVQPFQEEDPQVQEEQEADQDDFPGADRIRQDGGQEVRRQDRSRQGHLQEGQEEGHREEEEVAGQGFDPLRPAGQVNL